MKEEKKYYLSNKELRGEVMRCQELGLEQPSEKLMEMFMLLGKRIIRKMYYDNPSDYHDCLNAGFENMLKYWKKYNPYYPNAFAYYTQIFKTGMAKGWNELHPKRYKGNISLDANINDEEGGIHSL